MLRIVLGAIDWGRLKIDCNQKILILDQLIKTVTFPADVFYIWIIISALNRHWGTRHWPSVVLMSKTPAQNQNNIGPMPHVPLRRHSCGWRSIEQITWCCIMVKQHVLSLHIRQIMRESKSWPVKKATGADYCGWKKITHSGYCYLFIYIIGWKQSI